MSATKGPSTPSTRLKLIYAKCVFALFLTGNLILHFLRKLVVFLALLIAIAWGLLWADSYFRPADPELVRELETQIVEFPHGAGFHQITDSLLKYELLAEPDLFRAFARVTGKDKKIHAGKFNLPQGLTTWELLDYLDKAPSAQVKVTLPEGISVEIMAAILQRDMGIDSTQFMSLVNDTAFGVELLGESRTLHGYMLPETYFFDWNASASDIIRRLVTEVTRIFEDDSVQAALAERGRSVHDIMTLAAIVEGEALIDSERDTIAALYYNRLRLGWPLQADPTIQYILPGPPRRLLNKHLEIDSPYNTYKYAGLPPGPINNPGKQSILATIFPAVSPYLYMVAAGDGSHRFSNTLRQHNYWHKKFNEIRRRVRRNSR